MASINEIAQEFGRFQYDFFKWKNEVNDRLRKLEAGDYASSDALAEIANRVEALAHFVADMRREVELLKKSQGEENKSFWDWFKK